MEIEIEMCDVGYVMRGLYSLDHARFWMIQV